MKDVEIKGVFIPKGWCVFTYFRSIHLDDSLYDSPYQFFPWRWQKVRILNQILNFFSIKKYCKY